MTVLMPNWYYEKKDFKRSPSVLDGLDNDKESRYRREGARFIINVGTKMGLRYDTMATGVVYFHRFYMFHSFKTFPRYVTACCCLFLAGKVEETPKKCKDIIRTAKTFLTENQFAQFGDDPKEEVMTLERILLQTIKFDLQVDHPYGYLLKYAKSLKGDNKKLQNMVQMAWTFINDSLCTTLCLQWEPEVIAIALMYLAGKLTKFEVVDWDGRISKHAYWWDMFVEGMSIELLEDICHQVLDLYSTPMSNTPQDSPPATPPTKSTRKSSQPPSPIETSTSPAQSKVKEQPPPPPPPVGMPIPRLEPGELKRKVSLAESKKEVEGKIPRLEGKAIPIISGTNNSSPPKRHSGVKGFSSQPVSPNNPKPIEIVTKITKHIDMSKHSISLDTTFRSGIASIPNTQPYLQGFSLLPTENSTPVKPLQHVPVTPTTTYNITLPPPNATYAQSTASFFTAVASAENPSYSNLQPPPQIFPQQFSHPPPSVAPSTSLTRPPIQFSEQPHQYQALPPGTVPPFNSQYPPPPPPSIRPPNIISNSNVVHPPSEVSGIIRNAPPPPPPPGVPHRNTPPHAGTPRNSGPPPPPPGVPNRNTTPCGGTPRSSGPPPPGVTPRNSTPLLRSTGPAHDNMYGPRPGSDIYHSHQKGRGLRLPLDRPPGREYGPRGSYDDSPRHPRHNPEFDPSFQRRPLFPEFDQNYHRPHHPNQFGPNFDGQMPPRRFPHNLHHRSPRPRMMNNMQQQQQGTPTGIPPVRITGRY